MFKAACIRTTVFCVGLFCTIADVEYATAGWIDWHKNRHLSSTLGYLAPVEFREQLADTASA